MFGDHIRAVTPSGSRADVVETTFRTAMHTEDSRGGYTTTRARDPEARMDARRPGRCRYQHGDDRETSNLEAVEG